MAGEAGEAGMLDFYWIHKKYILSTFITESLF
jgi:hypothetical protein